MRKVFLCLAILLAAVFSAENAHAEINYERIAGNNRIETAVAVSKKIQNSSKVAVLANSTRYINALAGSTLANLHNAPILLVEKDNIPAATLAEMRRLGVESVYLLGGEAVISSGLEQKLADYNPIRLAGANRYETSYEIYKEVAKDSTIDKVFIAAKEVDAVASAAARGNSIPLLLVSENIPSFMVEIEGEKIVLGGSNALSDSAFRKLAGDSRIAGANRFETAVLLANYDRKDNVALVNGYNFVDAFTSGTLAHRLNANILLTDTYSLPKASKDYIDNVNKGKIYIIGGDKAVSGDIFMEGDASNPLDAAYWSKYNNYSKNILMDSAQIKEFNRKADQSSPDMRNILTYSNVFSGSYIKTKMEELIMPSNPTRANGSSYTQAQRNAWLANRNIAGIKDTRAGYAVAIQRTLLKTFPTYDENVKNNYFEFFTEDAVNPWEMMFILHTSKDGNWYFVMTDNYLAWIPKKDVALVSKEKLLEYDKMNFFVVTEPKINLNGWNMDMGTKIPMRNGRPLLPKADAKGNLVVSDGTAVKALHQGFLPYTEYKLFQQALKFEGEIYGWGGSKNAHDCSSFIEDIHKVFGIMMPRFTGHQEAVSLSRRVSIKGLSYNQKLAAIRKSGPGSVIYMKGHVVLYLGKNAAGQDRIIHQNGSTRDCAITALDFGGNYMSAYSTIQKYR